LRALDEIDIIGPGLKNNTDMVNDQ
jgi:hypothetical protein